MLITVRDMNGQPFGRGSESLINLFRVIDRLSIRDLLVVCRRRQLFLRHIALNRLFMMRKVAF